MKKLFTLPFLFAACLASAQESLGLHYDNGAASSGMLLNPAVPQTAINPWEISLVSAGSFIHNNYAYLDHQSILSMSKAFSNDNIADPQLLFTQPNEVKAFEVSFIQGPSAFMKLPGGMTVGLFTDFRSAASFKTKNFPSAIALDTIPYGMTYEAPPFYANVMNWTEFGVNAAMPLMELGGGNLAVGANVKVIGGMDGMYFINNSAFQYEKIPEQEVISISQVNIDYAYTYNLSNNSFTDLKNYRFNGVGASTDIGAVYTIGESPENYIWKFGASLNDLGRIHFSQNAGTYSLNATSDVSMNILDAAQIDDLSEFTPLASYTVLGHQDDSQTGSDFSVWMPSAISLQAERYLGYRFFVNATGVQRIAFSQKQIMRPNMISLTPRYESKWFAAGIPLVLVEYNDIHIGTAVRLGPLTIGSDDLLSWLAKGKFDGTDIYAGLRIFPLGLHGGENGGYKKIKGGDAHCPRF